MDTLINELLLEESFKGEIARRVPIVDHEAGVVTLRSCLQIGEDGNIARVNGISLERISCHLSYLIGSLDFLFTLINEESGKAESSHIGKEEAEQLKENVVRLLLELLSELSRTNSSEEIIEVIERITEKKQRIRKACISDEIL